MPIFSEPRRFVAVLQGFALAIAGIVVVACTQPAPPVTSATPTAPANQQGTAPRPEIEANVHYPALRDELAPLDQAMHAYADAQKLALVDMAGKILPSAERRPRAAHLDLDFTVATQTEDFVSTIGIGEGDFGGAHPLALRPTFNEHLRSGRIVALTDLFADATAALQALSVEARRRLAPDLEARLRAENLPEKTFAEREKIMRELLDEGTEPKASDFAAFLVDGVDGKAIGITLIFPPAQVASYAEGPQQVDVPARVFYAQLKPEFRDAFAVDKEDMEAASRGQRATP